jgi:hypothetical protein
MKTKLKTTTVRTAAALALVSMTAAALAQGAGEPGTVRLPAWYDGMEVTQIRKPFDPDANLYPAVAVAEEKPAQILGTFNTLVGLTDPAQHPVIDAIPGDPDYTGWWNLRFIYVARPLGPVTSMADIEARLCQVDTPAFPANIPACLQAQTPLIDITGNLDGLPDIKVPILNEPDPAICNR